MSGGYREKLQSYLQKYQVRLIGTMELGYFGLNRYSELMENSVKEARPYFNFSDLAAIHEKNKAEAKTLVCNHIVYS